MGDRNPLDLQVRSYYSFCPLTAYLAVNYMDRFLSVHCLPVIIPLTLFLSFDRRLRRLILCLSVRLLLPSIFLSHRYILAVATLNRRLPDRASSYILFAFIVCCFYRLFVAIDLVIQVRNRLPSHDFPTFSMLMFVLITSNPLVDSINCLRRSSLLICYRSCFYLMNDFYHRKNRRFSVPSGPDRIIRRFGIDEFIKLLFRTLFLFVRFNRYRS